MISQQKLQDTGLWEAWIEFDQFNPDHFGVLYVLGEIMISERSGKTLMKKSDHEDGLLILEVPARPAGRSRMKEILYSEPVDNLSQYSSVCIYAGTELVARFDEIEIMV
jgi:hypothetical protein